MKKWSMRILTLLSLLTLSGVAFAGNSLGSDAVTNHTDLSVSYLSQVFGTVGNSLQGTTGQMLGMLFYKFNQGILVVAGFWLSYLVLTTFLKSAHEGSFISPNRNIVIILLRVALGFGMLLPNPVTGYSIFQDVLMKVVVAGVSLADSTWSYGLQYIDNGGQVWRDPTTANNGTGIVSADQAGKILGPTTFATSPTFSSLGVGQQIFIDEVCMYAAGGQSNAVIDDDKNGQFIFPGATQSSISGCGSVVWAKSGVSSTQSGFLKQGATALVYDLLPAAKRYVCTSDPTANGCSGDTSDPSMAIGNAFFNSLLGYANAVTPLTMQTDSATTSRQFIHEAEKGGWMLAGRYYWDLSRAISNYQADSNIATYLPTVSAAALLPQPGVPSGQNAQVGATLNDGLGSVSGYTATAMTLLGNYAGASSSGGPAGNAVPFSDSDTMSNMPGAVAMLLWPYEDGLTGIVNNFSATQGSGYSYDPIVFLHNIGMRCLGLAGTIWIGTSVVVLVMSAVTIFCQSVVNLNSVLQAVVSWMKPFLMTMAVAFLGVGVLLGYYVPLYPYMLFTFGVIGWIIRVLVGMAAAPLVCLSLTHPEGHDFLGKAEQLLQLLLSVFIEPVLMVIGLFAGMILSYVSLRILVYTFSGFVSDLFYQKAVGPITGAPQDLLHSMVTAGSNFAHQNVGGSTLVYLTFPMLLIIFAAIVYTVTNKCFSVIHELPGSVMQWIGGPSMQSTAGQMADSVAGVVSQAGQRMGSGLSTGDGMGQITGADGKRAFMSQGLVSYLKNKKASQASGNIAEDGGGQPPAPGGAG
jgi:defect-in-organelle-trafficking protein DotA